MHPFQDNPKRCITGGYVIYGARDNILFVPISQVHWAFRELVKEKKTIQASPLDLNDLIFKLLISRGQVANLQDILKGSVVTRWTAKSWMSLQEFSSLTVDPLEVEASEAEVGDDDLFSPDEQDWEDDDEQ
ncbi:unnamed protein product [Rhizoctonia solani]|uniref:Uncharacterized protein n=1 Tax=Rhizoctonia solani TaxID=456999 RepID=A0A8H3DQD3_9AGAM|nr:unnamed protein product [Rhizoctonia solani]